MKQALTKNPWEIVYQEVENPMTKRGEALISVKSIGICGSDIGPYMGKNLKIKKLPFVMGHEIGGIIKEINDETSEFKVGDKVVIYPLINCGSCYFCKQNLEYLCSNQIMYGSPQKNGGLVEEIAIPIKNLLKINDSFNINYSSLIEPSTVAYHAVKDMRNSNVLVISVGAIGKIMCMLLKHNNCKVIAADVDKEVLDKARSIGADFLIDLREKNINKNIKKLKNYLGSTEVDAAIVGFFNKSNLDLSLETVRSGGEIIVTSKPKEIVLNLDNLFFKSLRIRGSISYTYEEFKETATLLQKRIIATDDLQIIFFPFYEVKEAFDYKANNPGIKVIITN